jgi:TnpA family transposase
MRRQVGKQLNRGEHRQGVARHVFFADQGEFRSGDLAQIMNKASCLSLLSNSILPL